MSAGVISKLDGSHQSGQRQSALENGAPSSGRTRASSKGGPAKRTGSHRVLRTAAVFVVIVFSFHFVASLRTRSVSSGEEELGGKAWDPRRQTKQGTGRSGQGAGVQSSGSGSREQRPNGAGQRTGNAGAQEERDSANAGNPDKGTGGAGEVPRGASRLDGQEREVGPETSGQGGGQALDKQGPRNEGVGQHGNPQKATGAETEAPAGGWGWVKLVLTGRQMKPRVRSSAASAASVQGRSDGGAAPGQRGGQEGSTHGTHGAHSPPGLASSATGDKAGTSQGKDGTMAEVKAGRGQASGGSGEGTSSPGAEGKGSRSSAPGGAGIPSLSQASDASTGGTSATSHTGTAHAVHPQKPIPLVTIFAVPTEKPCGATHFAFKNLQLARTSNEHVHVIGPASWRNLEASLGVHLEPWSSYQPVLDKFREELGVPKPIHVRWYILQEFLRRHKQYQHVFYFEPDISVFANITEAVEQLFKPRERHIMLMQPWSRLWGRLSPTQRPFTTRVAGHTSLWSRSGLADFLAFHRFFLAIDALNGHGNVKFLVELEDYTDEVILGWYTHQWCWRAELPRDRPRCKAEAGVGISSHRIPRIRGKFEPKFNVSSGSKPRMCTSTSWSTPGWCVFDRGNAVKSPAFKFVPPMKCPMTPAYTHFQDWMGRHQKPLEPVQFLTARLHRKRPWAP